MSEELRAMQRDRMKRMETLNTFDAKEWAQQQEQSIEAQLEAALTTGQDQGPQEADQFAHLLDDSAGAQQVNYDDYAQQNYSADYPGNYSGDYAQADYNQQGYQQNYYATPYDYQQQQQPQDYANMAPGEANYEGVVSNTTQPDPVAQQLEEENNALREKAEAEAREKAALAEQLADQQRQMAELRAMMMKANATGGTATTAENTTAEGVIKPMTNTTTPKVQQEGGPPGEDAKRGCACGTCTIM